MDAFIDQFTAQGPAWLHGVDLVAVFRSTVIGVILLVGLLATIKK